MIKQMVDKSIFRRQVKKYMEPVFLENGFRVNKQGRGSEWAKLIEDGEYCIGIGFFTYLRDKTKPAYRFQLLLDPEDVCDMRAYSHSGWPPATILKSLGIHVGLGDRLLSMGYDAWIPWPTNAEPEPKVFQEYAEYLIKDLYSRIEKGKKWTTKTHRWEYINKTGG